MPISPAFVEEMYAVVGPTGVITDTRDLAPFLAEERGRYQGEASVVIQPQTTSQVAEVVQICARDHVPIVPQGGNTGLCGGAVSAEGHVVMSLSRMNAIRALDSVGLTATVEAGVLLADLQQEALKHACLFPLSLASQGSCQIGGNISTNAGGVNVLRYGGMRDLCLGLEVVLADGTIWNGLKTLSKDNTGYALKHLFIGSEGTLGIITAAVLKLFPRPLHKKVAFCALSHVSRIPDLLYVARCATDDHMSAFELISREALELACCHLDGIVDPFDVPWPWYVLLECTASQENADVHVKLESFLTQALERNLIDDAVFAENGRQEDMLWKMREGISEAQKREGASIKHDISVPLRSIPELLDSTMSAVLEAVPGIRPCPFGHVGDGNIHFNFMQPVDIAASDFLNQSEKINRIVHDHVIAMGGSISAEHGIGRLKVDDLFRYKENVEIETMQRIKKAFDPQGLFNPGVILPP